LLSCIGLHYESSISSLNCDIVNDIKSNDDYKVLYSVLDSSENSFYVLVGQESTELGSERDSELLVLASGPFNGIEGFEMGSGVDQGGDSEIKVSRYSRVLRKRLSKVGISLIFGWWFRYSI
jgi:hypothetical protein